MMTEHTPKAGRPIRRAVDEDECRAGLRAMAFDKHVDTPHVGNGSERIH